jgi:hypothetical protein
MADDTPTRDQFPEGSLGDDQFMAALHDHNSGTTRAQAASNMLQDSHGATMMGKAIKQDTSGGAYFTKEGSVVPGSSGIPLTGANREIAKPLGDIGNKGAAPKPSTVNRGDFPPGLGGDAAYQKAKRAAGE